MAGSAVFTYAFIAVLGILLITVVILFGTKLGNEDDNNELSKQISIVAIITAICVFFWTALTYFYFMTYTDYLIPFMIVSNGFILCVVMFSLGLKSITIA